MSKEHYFKLSVYFLLTISSLLQVVVTYLGTNAHSINLAPVLLLLIILLPLFARRGPLEFYGITLERFKHISLLKMLLFTIVALVIIDPIGYLIPGFIEFARTNPSVPGGISRQIVSSISPFIIVPLALVVTSAGTFFEEALFRGLIQKSLLRPKILGAINPWFAIIMQAIIFGAVHILPLLSVPSATNIIIAWIFIYPTATGVLMGYLSYRYRSILPSWYFHWATNFISITLIALIPNIAW